MRGLPGLQDVTSDLQISNPQISIEIDRDRAAALGISPQQIEDALYTAYGTRQISTIYTPNNEYQVIMELAPEFQANPERDLAALRALRVGSARPALLARDDHAEHGAARGGASRASFRPSRSPST